MYREMSCEICDNDKVVLLRVPAACSKNKIVKDDTIFMEGKKMKSVRAAAEPSIHPPTQVLK